jgi:spore coat polysaccharide biosynthesis protein SpsF
MNYKTEQEEFWAGDFGNQYIDRNKSKELLASNTNFFSKALHSAQKINSVVEFGSNVGMNLRALKILYPDQKQFGIEINQKAASELRSFLGNSNVFEGSIFDFNAEKKRDLSLIKGVLIHINPEMLPLIYKKLYEASEKYVLICEYYNPVPVEIDYRGHSERLYKRDFCGDMMEAYPDLKLLDYGFAYKKDPSFSQDDITWFLLEK